ncbi:hypothetical protein Pcac1_g19950 [Phytophthora cactorum]|uniref:Uncharacterized protein n=1 Tax=Phytophthora cactorum TaxID=29920 RepID=A0A8T1AZW2_9STRA|nr:hypothetical protein Pcac1_g19950 [Phytophthora cactorum]KAG2791772.1 hypothetical protein PC111_g23764 [Phytophthora cactorum]KAG2854232.1 hypothetical protein PC113_g13478 [Phytophthora cactorum]KAG2883366.1 hypothetical protein PC114_g20628 [Phytophthora cactorum]KAG2893625.1 hypothetical protein PC115_g18408 [Phytophthora cactorum]
MRLEAHLSTRHARRLRRAEQKDGGGGADPKMAIRKKPSKHTTPAMETHRSKGMAHLVETSERMERAEAKDTTAAEPASETKDTTEAKDTTKAKDMPVAQVTAPDTEQWRR